MHPQHFHNIFITNLRWLVDICFNLNLPLKLLFCPPKIAINYFSLRIYFENIVDIIFLKINPYLLNYKGRFFFFSASVFLHFVHKNTKKKFIIIIIETTTLTMKI